MTHRCPTCGGRGTVDVNLGPGPYGIYPWPQETCRSCGGGGWIWVPDAPTPPQPHPLFPPHPYLPPQGLELTHVYIPTITTTSTTNTGR